MNADKTINGQYAGRSGPLFWLALKTALLTAITLGVYRFWAKTRIRKYIWSSAEVDGDGFEYTGTGIEKMLGFLVAIVVVAIFLGAIQAILFAASVGLASEWTLGFRWQLASYLAAAAALPLIYFAQYRARRYRLARTRWRGVRFGAEQAAWGYAVRALGYLLLVLATLGILLPLRTFRLQKYLTDRTWYGDAKFEQNGKWTALYPAMKHLFIGSAILVCGPALFFIAVWAMEGSESESSSALAQLAILAVGVVVGGVWLAVGLVSYRVRSFSYLAANRVLDGSISFEARPKTSVIVKALINGIFSANVVTGLVTIALIASFALAWQATGYEDVVLGVDLAIFAITAFLVGVVVLFALGEGLNLIWLVQPIIAHVVQSVTVRNADALDAVRQRVADGRVGAEGLADALDVGGAV